MLRRSILKMIGAAPVAAVVPTSTVLPAAASVTGLSSAAMVGGVINGISGESMSSGSFDPIPNLLKRKGRAELLKLLRPSWWTEHSKQNAKHTAEYALRNNDAAWVDVYALKSVSLSGKKWIIENRAQRRYENEEAESIAHKLERAIWHKTTGHEDVDHW